jgi:hypothetical protein
VYAEDILRVHPSARLSNVDERMEQYGIVNFSDRLRPYIYHENAWPEQACILFKLDRRFYVFDHYWYLLWEYPETTMSESDPKFLTQLLSSRPSLFKEKASQSQNSSQVS